MDLQATITSRIPESLLPPSTEIVKLIQKWQLFLAPLVDPALDDASALTESAWGILASELIVNLVIYDCLDISIKSYLLSSTASAGSSGTLGIVKKVVTGPTEAEYFSPKDTMSEVLKPGGLFSMTRDSICMLANRLSIKLLICPDFGKKVMPPKVHRTDNSYPE